MNLWTIMLLLLATLFAAPFNARRGKAPELGLPCCVVLDCVVISCGTWLYGLVEIAANRSQKVNLPIREVWSEAPGKAGVEEVADHVDSWASPTYCSVEDEDEDEVLVEVEVLVLGV